MESRTSPIAYPPRRPPFRDAPIGPRVNDRIRITPVRLIDEAGEMVGIVETDDARRRALELGLDLVEIAADVRPPVCRIMDFGKFKYEESKKDKANKAKSKTCEMKEVRLGRSMKIGVHDIAIRVAQARRFLIEGHKVQIVQNFKGREVTHRSRGDQRMAAIVKELSDLSKLELSPRMNGRRLTMILGPDKQKIETWKKAQRAAGKPELPTVPDIVDEPDDDDDDDDGHDDGADESPTVDSHTSDDTAAQ
ncbi:MAG: translation initiation factor IF-3 [Phycisphaerae bacterium]|nr:translation initiation factor IF-3 [Phycisphaerae bacterium]